MEKRKTFNSLHNDRGFSLLEAVISLFILAIMVSLASLSFFNRSPKYRLEKAVWEVHSRMNYARYKALFKGAKVRIKFEPKYYSIDAYDEKQNIWITEQKYFIEGVKLQANNSPIFHPAGTVSNLASIYVSNEGGKYKITIAISGRIKVVKL